MNNTTLQVLARATSRFNISISNEDTKPWSLRKTEQCYNYKTVVCNRITYTRSPLIPGNHCQCFNCRKVGCHFQSCLHPIDEAICKQNKTLFSTSMKPSLKVPLITLSGNQTLDINRHKMAWLESKNKASWLEAKKDNNLTHHKQERHVWRFPTEEEHSKHIIHGTPHIWNDNTCPWTMTNMIHNATSSDVAAAAAAIASTVFDAPSQKKTDGTLFLKHG